jgi:hypothetical protein
MLVEDAKNVFSQRQLKLRFIIIHRHLFGIVRYPPIKLLNRAAKSFAIQFLINLQDAKQEMASPYLRCCHT